MFMIIYVLDILPQRYGLEAMLLLWNMFFIVCSEKAWFFFGESFASSNHDWGISPMGFSGLGSHIRSPGATICDEAPTENPRIYGGKMAGGCSGT